MSLFFSILSYKDEGWISAQEQRVFLFSDSLGCGETEGGVCSGGNVCRPRGKAGSAALTEGRVGSLAEAGVSSAAESLIRTLCERLSAVHSEACIWSAAEPRSYGRECSVCERTECTSEKSKGKRPVTLTPRMRCSRARACCCLWIRKHFPLRLFHSSLLSFHLILDLLEGSLCGHVVGVTCEDELVISHRVLWAPESRKAGSTMVAGLRCIRVSERVTVCAPTCVRERARTCV